jgi:chromosome segregation ATPase
LRRASAGGEHGALSQGLSALDRLKAARRLLDKSRETRVAQDIERAVDRAEGIARDQARIADEVRRLGDGQGEDALKRVQRLDEGKDALAEDVQALEEQLDRMARETRRTGKEASRALREASATTSSRRRSATRQRISVSRTRRSVKEECVNPTGSAATVYRRQLATFRPFTRRNSAVLSVTTVNRRESAWAAMSMSFGPIGVPISSSRARTRP